MTTDADQGPGAVGRPARRLHVLHVCVPTEGDVAVVVLDYLRDQVDRGWRVTLACPSQGWLGYAAREVGAQVRWWTPAPVPEPLPRRGPGHRALLGDLRRLRRVHLAADPDVVHLHGIRAGVAGRLLVRDRVPTVYQPHGGAFAVTGNDPPGVVVDPPGLARALRWERYAARWTSELVCVSQGQQARVRSAGITGVDVTVVGYGVDVTRWRARGPADRRAARAATAVGDGAVALCLSRLSAGRGQRDLLAAWAGVRARVPDAELVLVGDGPDRRDLERLAASLPGVRLVGGRIDLATWLAAADVVVVPSRSPGTRLVPLQAMACARSLVVTAAEDVVRTVPTTVGSVVAVGDVAALTAAIVRRLGDPGLSDQEGWRGRRYVEQHHDCVAGARELARIYPRLLAARRA